MLTSQLVLLLHLDHLNPHLFFHNRIVLEQIPQCLIAQEPLWEARSGAHVSRLHLYKIYFVISGCFSRSHNVFKLDPLYLAQAQGTSVPFTATTGSDTMMKNGVASPINTRHQCITCMKEYEQKSLEELRLEDYQLGRKGSAQQNTLFGNTQAQPTGLFSSIAPASNTTSTFGTQQRTPTFGAVTPQTNVGGES